MLRTRIVSLLGAVLLLTPLSYGGGSFGTVRGVTRNAEGAPLGGVQVVIHSLDEGADRTALSDQRGAFLVEDLKPGRYQLTANKSGLASLLSATVELGPQQSLQVDMTLAAPADSRETIASTRAADLPKPSPNSNADGQPLTQRERQLLERIDRLEQRLAALEASQERSAEPLPRPPVSTQADAADQPGVTASAKHSLQAVAANQLPAAPAQASVTSAAATPPATPAKVEIRPDAPANASGTLPPSLGQGSTKPDSPTQPVMVASLEGTASLKPAEKSEAPSLMPAPGTSTAAKPSEASLASGTAVSSPQQASPDKKKKIDPFSDWDWTWLNGNPRTKDIYWDSKFFTPEIRADLNYNWQNHHPGDHTLGGSSEIFREGEVQMEQLGVGGDFHWDNVRARFMTQYGMYSETTPRNDASPANGEWNLDTAYRYLSEAYGGYHFNVLDGINVDAGIFLSYIGLFSYYNFDNWADQPSYVSSNTPWFFNGVRIQVFPTAHLKIEPWLINGWQSYGSANDRPGLGGQIKWTPYSWMNIIFNNYGLGNDDLYAPGRARIHTDDSIEIRYYDRPASKGLDKMAFSFTGDLGCEYGGGVSCTGDHRGGPKQSFIGGMLYNRWWFDRDRFGLTLGGGEINNPGRYLVLLPPINGETAPSAALNSPYFTENPGDKFKAWDGSLTFDWMPKQYITFRVEGDYRHANVPYWSGRGGITPPPYIGTAGDVVNGNGYPTQYACNNGAPSGQTVLSSAQTACSSLGSTVWFPDLVKSEFILDFDILVKF